MFFFCLFSCENSNQKNISHLLQKWKGKELLFPNDSMIILSGTDTIPFLKTKAQYTIVSYIDSMGCISCKLRLPMWKSFIEQLNSAFPNQVSVLLFLCVKNNKELLHILKRDQYNYPVCIDKNDNFNKLNHFPVEIPFQTFLLDRDNKVIAMGNPIINENVRELYMNIISGEEFDKTSKYKLKKTAIALNKSSIVLGHFNWNEEQKDTFILKNVGNELLIIEEVNSSCGCTTVFYSKEPVQPGKELVLEVVYKAERPEYFSKTIALSCNVEGSPIVLKIRGYAK